MQESLHVTHLLKLLDKMYKYEMDPTRNAGATQRTRDDGPMDGLTDGVKQIYPQTKLHCLEGWGWGWGLRRLGLGVGGGWGGGMYNKLFDVQLVQNPSALTAVLGLLGKLPCDRLLFDM